jgi:uncharacterized cupredoxin-like copper-binding protein
VATPSAEHWRNPNIKIERSGEGEPAVVYVDVWDREVEALEDPTLTLFAGPATTTLPRLSTGGTGWREVGSVRLDRLEGDGQIARFEVPSGAHQCLVAVLSGGGESNRALEVPADRAIVAGENVVARNMDFVGTKFERTLVVRNPTESAGRATLEVRSPVGVEFSLRGVEGSSVELAPGEERDMTLTVAARGDTEAEVTVVQRLELGDEEPLEGGFTYVIQP